MSKESTPERDRDVARVTEVVGAFLRTADLEVCTEKQVIAHVQKSIGDQLSQPVSAYKKTITGVIEAYLEEMDEAEAQPEEEEQAPKGKKRAGGPAAGAGTSKRARVPGVDDSDTQFSADLGHKRFARVRTYQGRLHVDIREFYEKDGSMAPGAKGLALNPDQWRRLAPALPGLLEAQRARRLDTEAVVLGGSRMASLSEFKGTVYLSLREHYEKDGKMLPGKKGISLDIAGAEALAAAAPAIDEALGGPAEAPPLPEGTAPPTARSGAVAATGGHGGDGEGGDLEFVDLGGMKRVSISRYGGRLSVDLREYYQSGSEARPGKKGIALAPDDWRKVAAAAGELSAALSRHDTSYVLPLSGKRRVSISSFKGAYYVNVREYYLKDGQEQPGPKGLSMSAAQWAVCAARVGDITAALDRAQAGG